MAQRLAGELALPVRFECADYWTPGCVPPAADVVYTYAWPTEARHTFALFERGAPRPGGPIVNDSTVRR